LSAAHKATSSGPILRTKLTLAPVPDDAVLRPRLLNVLNTSKRHRLTLLSAPAGTGKSTLLAQWVVAANNKTAHISVLTLDPKDNQPIRFLRYITAALEPFLNENVEIQFLLQDSGSSLETVLIALINALSQSANDIYLILDDYEVISHSEVHHLMAFMLDYLPSNVHLLIATQIDPPLPLARLRAQGLLQELRLTNLAFTEEETQAFLQIVQPTLSPEAIQTIWQKTEGWAIGLRLAAIEISGTDNPTKLVAEFSGTNRYITDYFDAEIFSALTEAQQHFVVQTAILDNFSAALCDSITGNKQSQAVLRTLEQQNIFLITLDSNRRQYRYHRLFVDYLRERFKTLPQYQQRALHRSAAAWLEQNARVPEAIPHWLAAEAYLKAEMAIETLAQEMISQGNSLQLLEWLNTIPESERQSQTSLQLLYASASAMTGKMPLMTSHIDDAARELLFAESHSDTELVVKAALALNTAETLRLNHQPQQASRAFKQAYHLNLAAGNLSSALLAGYQYANLQVTNGKLREAHQWFRRLVQLSGEDQTEAQHITPIVALIHVGISGILLEWNELDSAQLHAESALQIATTFQTPQLLVVAQIGLAVVQQALGHSIDALQIVQNTAQIVAENELLSHLTAYVAAHHARILLLQSQLDEANTIIKTNSLNLIDTSMFADVGHTLSHLVWLRYCLLSGNAENLVVSLPSFLDQLRHVGYVYQLIEGLVLLAMAHMQTQNSAEAVVTLERALLLSAVDGYSRVYLDMGVGLIPLLRQISMQSEIPEEGIRLLRILGDKVFGDEQTIYSVPRQLQPLAVPLSERELEILKLISDGLSNYEIASRLIVTLETVKWHIKNIYRKLDVRSRTQAITRARELRL
jgi:LuxR family transcriptional regulator, maltose regulon positive regulatory protein